MRLSNDSFVHLEERAQFSLLKEKEKRKWMRVAHAVRCKSNETDWRREVYIKLTLILSTFFIVLFCLVVFRKKCNFTYVDSLVFCLPSP